MQADKHSHTFTFRGCTSEVTGILIEFPVGHDVSVFGVFAEGLVQLDERRPVCRLQRPAGEHQLVDAVWAAGRLAQPVILVLYHVKDLPNRYIRKRECYHNDYQKDK